MIGEILDGQVEHVYPYSARIRFPRLTNFGYLHISQIATEYVQDIRDLLKEGQSVTVQIVAFDEIHDCWEVSRRAVLLKELAQVGFTWGRRHDAEINQANESCGYLRLDSGAPAYMDRGSVTWGIYDILYAAGKFRPSQRIEVVATDWDRHGRGVYVRPFAGTPDKVAIGSVHKAKVLWLRTNYVKKRRSEIHDVLYASLDSGEVVHVYVTKYREPLLAFPIGESVRIRIESFERPQWLLYGTIEPPAVPLPPTAGEEIDARVIQVMDTFAVCVLSDNVTAVLRHDEILKDAHPSMRNYLVPGDVVRVTVNPGSEVEGRMSYRLRLLKLVDRPLDTALAPDAILIDLTVPRRQGARGGYQRDTAFRDMVLSTYGDTCCICGVRYKFGAASAMQAAHIIPKSHRGADILSNSICLCPLHHWAFDKGFVTVDEENTIVVSRQVLDIEEGASTLSSHHGQRAHIPTNVALSPAAVGWHRRNVFLDR
jgi:predicted RNA-binding protein with RPS1 domain/translation initiation factor IF-1